MRPHVQELTGKTVCSVTIVSLVLCLSLGILISVERTKYFQNVTVVVAKRKILPYTPVRDAPQMFELKELPLLSAPAKFFSAIKQLEGGTICVAMEKGTPLIPYMYKDKSTMGIGGIEPCLRAVHLIANVDLPDGGFVDDDARVDIIHSLLGGDGKEKIHLVLEDVSVADVNRLPVCIEDNHCPARAEIVVVASWKQARDLIQAMDEGGIFMVVLNPNGKRILSQLTKTLQSPETESRR